MNRNPNPSAHPMLRAAVDVTRFWGNVERRGPDECWPWRGYKDRGYGYFVWNGRLTGAHELALSFTTGEMRGNGLDTCHSCDNAECCNPAHLRFDTRLSNVQEMDARGRRRSHSTISEADVLMMRNRRAAGARQKDLAEQFGISQGMVSMIVRGQRWAHAGGPIEQRERGI
jgi:hypothetical protein